MQMTDAVAAYSAADSAPANSTTLTDRLVGLALMAVLPALFWTAMFAVIAPIFGYAPSPAALATMAGVIGAFLAMVCCALTASKR